MASTEAPAAPSAPPPAHPRASSPPPATWYSPNIFKIEIYSFNISIQFNKINFMFPCTSFCTCSFGWHHACVISGSRDTSIIEGHHLALSRRGLIECESLLHPILLEDLDDGECLVADLLVFVTLQIFYAFDTPTPLNHSKKRVVTIRGLLLLSKLQDAADDLQRGRYKSHFAGTRSLEQSDQSRHTEVDKTPAVPLPLLCPLHYEVNANCKLECVV